MKLFKLRKLLPRFKSVGHCLQYYQFRRPADLKPPSNGESYYRRNYADFDPEHPHLLWTNIALGFDNVMKRYPENQKEIWRLCRMGGVTQQISVEAAAAMVGVSRRTATRWLSNIQRALEHDFIKNGLLPEPQVQDD